MLRNFGKSVVFALMLPLGLPLCVARMNAQLSPSFAVGQNQDGRLEVFCITGSSVFHSWQTIQNGGWSEWETLLANDTMTNIAVGQNSDGELTVFGTDSGSLTDFVPLRYISQAVPNGGWSNWTTVGYTSTDGFSQWYQIAVGKNQDGTLQMFAIDASHLVETQWEPFGGGSSCTMFGSNYEIDDVAVGLNSYGELEVFAVDTHGTLLHTWGRGCSWSPWTRFSVSQNSNQERHIDSLALGRDEDGRLEVFAVDNYRTLLHSWQTQTGGWSFWQTLGGGHHMNQIEVAQNQDGRLQVFGTDTFGTFLSLWQTTANGSSWTNWQTLGGGGRVGQIAVGTNQDGRLEVFDMDSYGIVRHVWQTEPNSEMWTTWQIL